ncbi:hypothetical protein [Streptomyces spiramenti]|uniref:SWIM-type domain-containing protein n=1 Tax=Streptomyces spiramenti TaxID=2720606 RepID=A0ABX1AL51_9ACTN|nr:hypothetical protein [Streptomyces spiramenti]NJP66118.1 hypothetical protein [Streptomyces spiramenti]
MSSQLPPVAPEVTAEIVGALSPRLRKRLDAAVTKLTALPVSRDGDTVRLALDEETAVELHAEGGAVTTADAVRCGCLLAPACVHRAAVVSAAPIAEPAAPEDPHAAAPDRAESDDTASPVSPARAPDATGAVVPPAAGGGPSPADPIAGAGTGAKTGTGSGPPTAPRAAPEAATDAQVAACAALFTAAAEAIDAGRDGAGAVHQAELLRSAHSARLAGLHRPAAAAVSVVTQLRAARSGAPEHRLAELAGRLRELLHTTHRLPVATGPEFAALRGTARRSYASEGSLRLHGLFSESILTPGGYAGAVTWTVDAAGHRYTVADVAPGGANRAAGAGDHTLRMGDTALTHRELSRSGLALSGATLSPSGRLGAGSGVRAVRAAGSPWTGAPLSALWEEPLPSQVARALTAGEEQTSDRDDLLFLHVTLAGAAREAGGDCLLAHGDGLTIRLTVAHDHPALPHRDNLRLLASRPGLRLRAVARLDPAAHPRARLLAISHPTDEEAHVNLGLERLQLADLTPATTSGVSHTPAADTVRPATAPLHLLRRRLHHAVAGGRGLLTSPPGNDLRALRDHALPTAAELLENLHRAAADRSRDTFGRLRATDPERFARAWLAVALYTEELDRALCAEAWTGAGA